MQTTAILSSICLTSLLTLLLISCGSDPSNPPLITSPSPPVQPLQGNNTTSTAFQTLTALTEVERSTILTDNGFTNSKGKVLFVYGRVQLSAVVNNCKAADLQIKMSSSGNWLRLTHLFVEGNPQLGTGNGVSFPVNFFLPVGASVRVKSTNTVNCTSGIIFLGGDVLPNGPGASDIYDWSYTFAQ